MIEISMTELLLFVWGAVMTLLYFKTQTEYKEAEYLFSKTLYLIAKKKAVLIDDGDTCHLKGIDE